MLGWRARIHGVLQYTLKYLFYKLCSEQTHTLLCVRVKRKDDETQLQSGKNKCIIGTSDSRATLLTVHFRFPSREEVCVEFRMSFENAEAYLEGNQYSKVVTKTLINEFYDWFGWKKDGKDSILDIGSGPGNAFYETLYSRLPENFSRIVLSDISKPMVELQKKVFQGIDRVSSEILDIGSPIDENLSKKLGTFDHVTSFFCLMFVKDQQLAMDNIYKLLKPGGDCFHVIAINSPIFDTAIAVYEKPRWKDYCTGWQDFFVLPYRKLNEAQVKEKAFNFMKQAGFSNLKAEIRYDSFVFSSDEAKEKNLRVMPTNFSRKVTPEEEEEFFQDRLQYFDQFALGNYRDNTGKIDQPNSLLILYGKKPE
ncbi:juvenile hormone acid O-methyltransferase-like [Phlebotomus argentipes]|uniref:juvenile hormone acid O-methyltransferase-like n=1 Tax=Phlebotomus argentipes TaxID=94469 RepID=UPI002892DA5B|nr:juvenile hormone acid O-methyltransferase-like [Phlebotomus argentipes]